MLPHGTCLFLGDKTTGSSIFNRLTFESAFLLSTETELSDENIRSYLVSTLTRGPSTAVVKRAIQLILHRIESRATLGPADALAQGCLLLLAEIMQGVIPLLELETLPIRSLVFKESRSMRELFCSPGDIFPGKDVVSHVCFVYH